MPRRSAAAANGTLTMKTADQSNHSSNSPPVSGPRPIPTAARAAQIAIALARSSPVKRLAMIESVAGMISAAPTPMAARTAITWSAESAISAPRLASPKIDTPVWRASFRPKRSPSVPKTSSRPAKTSRYESTIHCSFEGDASNSSCSVGSATLRIVLSSPMITRLSESTPSVLQRRAWTCGSGVSCSVALTVPPSGSISTTDETHRSAFRRRFQLLMNILRGFPPSRSRNRYVLRPAGFARGRLGRRELALDEGEPAVPEAGVGEVDPDDPAELLGRHRAAGRQQLQVRRDELLAVLLVAAVDGECEQLPVGVRVDVAGCVDEVRDVRPPAAVALGHLDGVAEHLLLRLGPERADAVERQLALRAPRRVRQVLEAVHRDLPEHGRDRALDALGQQPEPRRRRRRLVEQAAEHERLAEHAGGLRQRQRRREVEDA